ncbi:MAG: tetratricopeptide repeat protein [Candidatus Taylorbacteria bacterium]|nr:tetratricopeptide repeat protein [Candidatus Taylorbacteria bacterium]
MANQKNSRKQKKDGTSEEVSQVSVTRQSNDIVDVVLRSIILCGIFILPFLCLFVSSHLFFPFITGKNFSFRIIVEIIACLWIILALRDRSALPKFSRIFQAFGVFVALIFISDLLSPNVSKSFWSNYERMEGWVTLAHLFVLFVVLSSVMTKKVWEWLFRVSLFVSFIIFIYSCRQLLGQLAIHQGATRIDATIGNSAYLGGYMLFHVFFALYLLSGYARRSYETFEFEDYFWIISYSVFALADTFILYKTATRGATIGLVAGIVCVTIGLAVFEKKNKILRSVSIAILAVIVLVGGLFIFQRNSDFVKNHEPLFRLAAFTDDLLTFDTKAICEGEMKSRCLLWPVALKGVGERPLLGWGQESFNYVFNKYYDPLMFHQEQWFDRTHNIIFDWLIAGGILGLLAYLSIFGFTFYYLWRKGSPFSFSEKSLLTGLFVGYFFHNLTVFDNITSYIPFIMVLAYIDSFVGVPSPKVEEKVGALDSGLKNRMIIPLVCLVTVFILYKVNAPPILAATELIQALSNLQGGPAVNLARFEKALSHRSFGDPEIREQLLQTATQASNAPNLDQKIKGEFFSLARNEMLLQLEQAPNDARYQLFNGTFLMAIGDLDNAILYLKKAQELSPKKQAILFSVGSAYLSKKDYPNAVATMKIAFDGDPTLNESRTLYGLSLIYAKQPELAAEVLKPIPLDSVLGDERFIVAFYTSGYFENALQSANALIKKNPSNANYYFMRAAVLNGTGRKAEAIADLNRGAELNPSAKAQADDYVKQIKAGKMF